MKKIALAVTAASVLLAGAASAADMAVKARRAPMPAPTFSWTGCYVGGNFGYARGDGRSDAAANPIFIATNPAAATAAVLAPSSVGVTPDGFTAGVGVGCNYQTGIFVLGAEGDINYSDLGTSQIRGPFPSGGFAPHTWEENFRSNWFATARARAGVVLAERHLLYVTGGAAFAEYSWLKALDFPGFAGFRYQGTFSDSRVGWVVGAGWEYAFNSNWSAKVEYLHMDFGSTSATTPTPPAAAPPGTGFVFSHNFREDVVRVGLNYRFGLAGPVVAKY
ncbi:MAG: Outer rane immunogenic protein [Bradyrhizobium sp.]|nr:Outer rane immunogenic protein [Bradyrhizobium sp.]